MILFIDEMHQLVGAGGADGAIDASNILKPSLARGQLRCMGATTTEEYGKYIEKDASLARRFQPVYVSEPTDEHTEVILKGLRHRYEIHHRVRIDDSAIKAAIKLARKYLPHLRFPDKAIDLIDEAAATVRNRNESKSDLFRQVEERLSELRQQLSKLEESGSKTSAENIRLQTEIAGLCSQGVELAQSLIQQQELVKDVFELEKNMERLRQHLAHERTKTEADVQGQQKSAAELADNANSVEKLYTQLQKQYGYDNRITDKAIAKVICDNTGIPTDVMLGDGEKERLLNMEKELKKRIVGQDNALKTIAKCIRLSSAGLRYHDRPLGVFLLLGSTVSPSSLLRYLTCILLCYVF